MTKPRLKFRPIKSNAQWQPWDAGIDPEYDFDIHLSHDDKEEIRALLVGRRVVKVVSPKKSDAGHLMLDDGTVLKLFGNDGGCACTSGCYTLTHLEGVDNVITAVEFEDKPDGDDYEDGEGVYRIFVFADNKKVNLATFQGTDGNGYYGTGYHILVRRPEK